MELKDLNERFNPDGSLGTNGLREGEALAEPIRSEISRSLVHELHIGNTIVLVPDGVQSRQLGESYSDQAVGASLGVQNRIDQLRSDPTYHDKSVLIYTPNSDDANLAATIAYANGIDAVVVDGGNPIRIGELGDFGREFTARGGELRAGGQVSSIREDLGIGPPVSVVDIELQRGPGGVEARGSVMGAKDIATSAVTGMAIAQAREWLFDGKGTVGLGAFGPSAVVDAHGDGLALVGGLVGLTLRVGGGPVTMVVANLGANAALQEGVGAANAWLNRLSPGDINEQASVITTQLGDSWLSGTSLSEVGQGTRNGVEVAVAADLLRGIHELESLRQPVTAAADRGGLGAVYNNMQIDQKQAPLRAELEFWQQHLGSEAWAGSALAMASPVWEEMASDLVKSLETLHRLHSVYQQKADSYAEPEYPMDDEARRWMSDRLKDIERIESQVVRIAREQDSLLRAGEAATGLVEPGVSWAESALVRDWYAGMQVGERPLDALASLALDVDGRMSDEFVQRFDTPEMRAAFDASYSGPEAGRELAYQESLKDRGAEVVVKSGLTPRNFAEMRWLDVPGNANAWAPGMPVAGSKGSVPEFHLDPYLSIDAGGGAPQPNLEMDLTIDGSVPWPSLEMDLSIDPPDISPFSDSGSLNPEYVLSLRSPEAFEAFLESDLNPLFAAHIDIEDMSRQVEAAYYRYLSELAAYRIAAETGIDAERILDLDVPANPNARGYLSPVSGARDGALESRVDDPVVDATAPGWSAEQLAHHAALSSGANAVYSGYRFYQALRDGGSGDGVTAGIGFARDLHAAGVDLGGVGKFASGPVAGGVVAAIGLAEALGADDTAGAAQAGVQLASVANPGLLATHPGLAYVGSLVRLADGDPGGAALDAMSARLMTAGPYGWAAAAVLQLAGGKLMEEPDPRATLWFRRDEEGALGFETFSNRTGAGLEQHLARGTGEGLLHGVRDLEAAYGHVLPGARVDADRLPALTLHGEAGRQGIEWRLEGGRNLEGGVQLLGTDPDGAEISRALRDVLLITHMQPHWQVGAGHFVDPVSGESVRQAWFVPGGGSVGSHHVSRAVGTGVFAGGGNVGGNRGLTVARDQDIRSLGMAPRPTVEQQLAAVQRTWRVERGLFSGDSGRLLALAAGAGLVGLDAAAHGDAAPAEALSVFEHEHGAALLEGVDTVILAGHGVASRGERPPAPPGEDGDAVPDTGGVAETGEADGADGWPPLDSRHDSGERDAPAAFREGVSASSAGAAAADALRGDAPGNDPFAGADALTAALRDLAARQGGDAGDAAALEQTEPHGQGASPGGGARATHEDAAIRESAALPSRPEIPVGHHGSVLEDRFLVTDAERLLAGEAEGARLLDLGVSRHGLVEWHGDGDIHFVPDPDFHGAAGFRYRIETADGRVLERRAEIEVLPVNDRPVARDDVLHAMAGAPVALDPLLLNDSDVDGEALHIALVGQVSRGAVTGSAESGFTYVPEPYFFGEVQLVYVVEDSAGARAVARATLVIAEGENNAPEIAYAVVAEGVEESPVRLHQDDLLARVFDPEGDAVRIESIRAASGGEVHWHRESGEIVFDPHEDFHGTAELVFDVADVHGAMATGSAGIEIANVPDPIRAAPLELALAGGAATRIQGSELLSAMHIDNPDGGTVEIVGVRMAEGESGRVTWHEEGVIQWISAPGHGGPSAFEVRLSNGIERGVARIDVMVEEALPGAGYHDLLDELAGVEAGGAGPEPVPSSVNAGDATGAPAAGQDAGEESDAATGENPGQAQNADAEPSGSGGQQEHSGEGELAESAESAESGQVDPGVILPGLEDRELTFTVSDLLPDAGGAARLRGIVLDDPAHGQLRVEDGGQVTFVPTADFFGMVGLAFTVDDDGAAHHGRATLAIENVDDAPVVTDRNYKEPYFNFDEDEVAVFTPHQLLGASTDADGERLVLAGARLHDETLGEVSITDDGRLRLQPAADFHGDIAFDVDVTDGHSTVGATMTVRFWPVNDAPRPLDDHAATLEETELRVAVDDLLANDVDIDGPHGEGEGLRLVGVWAAAGGSARIDDAAGELVFQPDRDFFGDAWVDTVVADGAGAWAVSRLHVDVANRHDPVEARDDVVHVDEDTDPFIPLAMLTANDHNPDRGPLTLVSLDTSGIFHGALAIDDSGAVPGIRYTSGRDYHGTQHFTYTVTDAAGHASSAGVTLVVDPVNDAPVVAPWHLHGTEDVPVSLSMDSLNARAVDVEGDWTRVTALYSKHGEVRLDAATGLVTFTPAPHLNSDLNGAPLELRYLVTDEGGASGEGVVYLDLAAVDDPPEAFDDVVLAWGAGPAGYVNRIAVDDLLANDVEHDGEPLSLLSVTGAQTPGAVVAFETGDDAIAYTAAAGFSGDDRFRYTVTDASGNTDTARVRVVVLENRPPVAHDFATVAAEDTVLVFAAGDFAAHVDDPDRELAGMPEALRVVEVGNAVNGHVSLAGDGSVVFEPTADYNSVQHGGVAAFDFVVEDIVGHRAGASASIVYTPVNDAPVAVAEHLGSIDEDSAGLVFTGAQLLANDYDVDGDPLHIVSIRASGGSVGLVGDDTYRFVPARDYNGTASIRYVVSDGELQDEVSSSITVRPVNDRPVVQFDHAHGYDNGVRNTASGLLDNDYDVDGDPLHIAGITATSGNVQVTSFGGGKIHWQASSPGSGFVRYNVSDGNGGVTESRLDLSISHRAIPPEFQHFAMDRSQGTYHNVTVHVQNGGHLRVVVEGSARATDPDGPDSGIRYAGTGIAVSHTTGDWRYETTLQLSAAEAGPGNWVTRTVQFPATMRATDVEGNIAETSRTFRFEAHIQMNIASKPVVLDLDGNGLNLVGIKSGEARFDWDGDGIPDRTGWIAGDGDALLVYDHDGDGRVSRADEISFVGYLEGAETDLEGLRAFDSDGDGYLSANDNEWAAFGVWMDDGDGLFDEGEFATLDQVGITSLSLHSDGNEIEVDGNVIHGEALFTRADGSTGTLGDVAFSYVRGGESGDMESWPGLEPSGSPDIVSRDHGQAPLEPGVEDAGPTGSAAAGIEADEVRDTTGPPGGHAFAPDDPSGGIHDLFELPDDEEFDRMAHADIEQLARRPAAEPVAPAVEEAWLPGPVSGVFVEMETADVIAA